MANDADLEYSFTPEDSEYERTDIEPSIATRFALWLAIAMAISVAIVYGTFWFFEGRTAAMNEQARQFPLAVGAVREPPAPRLQTQPFKDVAVLRMEEQEVLSSYGWVDQSAGVVHIPIDEAMRIVAERGLVRSAPEGGAGSVVVQDSSAGRTSVPR